MTSPETVKEVLCDEIDRHAAELLAGIESVQITVRFRTNGLPDRVEWRPTSQRVLVRRDTAS